MLTSTQIGLAVAIALALAVGLEFFGRTDSDADQNRLMATRAALIVSGSAIKVWAGDKGRMPTAEEGLVILSKGGMVDGWGRSLVYRPGKDSRQVFELYSLGRPGVDQLGGGDNISYWSLSDSRPAAAGTPR